MTRFFLPLAVIALLLAHPGCASAGMPQGVSPGVEDFIRQSAYIFVGTVEKLRAATMPVVQVTDRTAVVRVDEVLYPTKTLADFTSKEITVQLKEPQQLRAGERAVFFTQGGIFGKSMAVLEVGHLEVSEVQVLRRRVAEIAVTKANEDLQRRMASAEVVLVGKVLSVKPAKLAQRGPITEHDPDWYEAEIEVHSAKKGQLPGRTVLVLFSNSEDVMWDRAPKLKEGQEGAWILHKNEVKWPGIEDRYTCLNSLDYQPKDQLERVERLIKGIG